MSEKTAMFNFIDGEKEVRVGDRFISVDGRGRAYNCIVTKLGNKFISTDLGDKFYISTGREQCDYSPSYAYSSMNVYEVLSKQRSFISEVERQIRNMRDLNYQDAIDIRKILDRNGATT
jgi:hypothetical protein